MSETIGGAMMRYFGNPPSELNIEEQLKRDIATLEQSMKKVRRRRQPGKSRAKSKTKRAKRNSGKTGKTDKSGKSRKSNRTLKHRT